MKNSLVYQEKFQLGLQPVTYATKTHRGTTTGCIIMDYATLPGKLQCFNMIRSGIVPNKPDPLIKGLAVRH